jgi:hypothetical protein
LAEEIAGERPSITLMPDDIDAIRTGSGGAAGDLPVRDDLIFE